MHSIRLGQKLILLFVAILAAGILGLVAHALSLSGVATAVAGGVILGLIVAFGAPFAFDMSRSTGVAFSPGENYLASFQTASPALDEPSEEVHLQLRQAAAWRLAEFSAFPDIVRISCKSETPEGRTRFLVATVDETSPGGPSVRVVILPARPDDARLAVSRTIQLRTALAGASPPEEKLAAEGSRYIVPEARRRRHHHPQVALRMS